MAPQDIDAIVQHILPYAKQALAESLRPAQTTLLEAEDLLRRLVPRLALAILQDFVNQAALPVIEQRPRCAKGHPMSRNSCTKEGQRSQHTSFGELRIPDVRFYCRKCCQAERPTHAALGSLPDTYSLPLCELAVDLVSEHSIPKSAKILRRQHELELSHSALLRLLHGYGSQALTFLDAKLEAALRGGEDLSGDETQGVMAELLEVQLDGAMAPVAYLEDIEIEPGQRPELSAKRKKPKRHKECYYCEARLGVVSNPASGERLYTLRHRDDLEPVFRDLRALCGVLGNGAETQIHGLADGAPYIEQRMRKEFEAQPFLFTLDRIHLREKLYEAQAALAKIKAKEAKGFVERAVEAINAGQVKEIIEELRRLAGPRGRVKLKEVATYLENRDDSLNYGEMEELGWSVSSSLAESGHRHVMQQRVKISGAWWLEENLPGVFALRALKANGWWGEFWAWCRERWQERALDLRSRRAA